MKHWVAQALFLLMALCLFLPCFAAAEEAAQTAVTIDFEDGNAAAFSQSGSCTVGVTESQAHSGKQSLRVSGRGSNNWDAVDLSAASLGIEAGAKVHLSACVYVESSEDGVMAIGKAGGDYAYYAQVNVKGKEWTEISCDFEADAGVNIRFLTADAQGIAHFSGSGRGKRIAVAFAVDGDTGNSVIVFKKNIFIFPDGCPFSFCLHNLYSILIDDNNSSTYGCLRPCR